MVHFPTTGAQGMEMTDGQMHEAVRCHQFGVAG